MATSCFQSFFSGLWVPDFLVFGLSALGLYLAWRGRKSEGTHRRKRAIQLIAVLALAWVILAYLIGVGMIAADETVGLLDPGYEQAVAEMKSILACIDTAKVVVLSVVSCTAILIFKKRKGR